MSKGPVRDGFTFLNRLSIVRTILTAWRSRNCPYAALETMAPC
jgi:hypothetical protein